MRPHFRFEDLEVWQLSVALAMKLHRVADRLDARKLYRYAEQVRGAGMSLPNNIAEGSGSSHTKEFKQFLNIARRSLFEDASMLLLFERLGLIGEPEITDLLQGCDELGRKLTNLTRSIKE